MHDCDVWQHCDAIQCFRRWDKMICNNTMRRNRIWHNAIFLKMRLDATLSNAIQCFRKWDKMRRSNAMQCFRKWDKMRRSNAMLCNAMQCNVSENEIKCDAAMRCYALQWNVLQWDVSEDEICADAIQFCNCSKVNIACIIGKKCISTAKMYIFFSKLTIAYI